MCCMRRGGGRGPCWHPRTLGSPPSRRKNQSWRVQYRNSDCERREWPLMQVPIPASLRAPLPGANRQRAHNMHVVHAAAANKSSTAACEQSRDALLPSQCWSAARPIRPWASRKGRYCVTGSQPRQRHYPIELHQQDHPGGSNQSKPLNGVGYEHLQQGKSRLLFKETYAQWLYNTLRR